MFEQKIFIALLCLDSFILVLDLLMWILDGKPGASIREFYYIVTAFYYTMNPLICMMWYFYVDYQVYKNGRHLRKVLAPMIIPAAINCILAFASIFHDNLMFYIDGSNVYHRGNLFPVMALISFFYLIYSLIFVTLNRKAIPKHDFIPLFIFEIPPFIGGIIQSLIYGASLIWVCVTLSILIVFINIQNNQLYTDYLTGLFNRRQLDKYLNQKLDSIGSGKLAGLMIDLNSFKAINDVYGHQIGDKALQHTADILRKTFRKSDDFIARYGGDEFVVLMAVKDLPDLQREIQNLKEKVKQFNAQKIFPFEISLSIGYDFYRGGTEADVAEFLKHIDHLMYADKQDFMKSHTSIN